MGTSAGGLANNQVTLLDAGTYTFTISHNTTACAPATAVSVTVDDINQLDKELMKVKYYDKVALFTHIKYEGYIKRELEDIKKFKKMENEIIPQNFNYDSIEGLSLESKQRLKEIKPLSLGQASRINGLRPTDLTLLLVYLRKNNKK